MGQREIKFRLWVDFSKKYYYDYELYLADDFDSDETVSDIFKSGTWEQYAGIKDKNGKEIYEGDILQKSEQIKPVTNVTEKSLVRGLRNKYVFFHEGAFKIRSSKKDNKNHLTGLLIIRNGLEVIGNIHENPELIK